MIESQNLIEKKRGIDTFWLRPKGSSRNSELLPAVLAAFEDCFAEGNNNIILNLEQVKFPSPSFIVMLLEMTARARRLGGDVKIIKLSTSARSNLLSFSPLTYLSISDLEFTTRARPGTQHRASEQEIVAKQDTSLAKIEHKTVTIRQIKRPIPTNISKNENSTTRVYDSGDNHNLNHSSILQKYNLRIASRIELLYQACDFVTSLAAQAGMQKTEISKIKIAVYEACLNVIEHAYRSKPNNWIDIFVVYNSSKFMIQILDRGLANTLKPPANDLNVENLADTRKVGGMGMHIIRRSVDIVKYETDSVSGNKLIMIKNLK